MKSINTIKKLLAIFFVIIGLTSCFDDFLKENINFYSPANFYNSERDALVGLTSVYDAINGGGGEWSNATYGHNIIGMIDCVGDVGYAKVGGGLNISNFNWGSQEKGIMQTWNGLWVGIARANTVINRVNKMEDFPLKQRILAEARFLRAHTYYHLVGLWENVPNMSEEFVSLSQAQVSNVGTLEANYKLMEDDLQFAENNLPEEYGTADWGRVTKGTAKAMLARVYLIQKKWALAAAKSKEVINMNYYKLYDNYKDIFSVEKENEPRGERMFEMENKGSDGKGEGTYLPYAFAPYGTIPFYGGWDLVRFKPGYYDSFPEGKRKDAFFIKQFVNVFTSKTITYPDPANYPFICISKFASIENPPKDYVASDQNYIILRYAEVLLMNSEAENEVNGPNANAVFGINQVRQRAGLPALNPASFSKAQLREAIVNEYTWELAGECVVYYLYKRHNILEERAAKVGLTATSKHYRYPIPQTDLDLVSTLKQNEGY